ncbi:MAG: PsiF family protein [Beijerinckiaceae bacterium]|nr:PsiF family protein [Beijerinckiaceae bacterium]
MKALSQMLFAGACVFALSHSGLAQMQTVPPAPPAAPAAPRYPAIPRLQTPDDLARKAKAKECSAKADAQGLHGEPRKAFRDKCKKESAGSAKPKL